MTYSLPVIDEARSEARNATNSATSSRPVEASKWNSAQRIHQTLTCGSPVSPRLCRQPLDQSLGSLGFGESWRNTNHPYAVRANFFGETFAVIAECGFGRGVAQRGFKQR
jgi:hypothetical protein